MNLLDTVRNALPAVARIGSAGAMTPVYLAGVGAGLLLLLFRPWFGLAVCVVAAVLWGWQSSRKARGE